MSVKCRVLTFNPLDERYERLYAAVVHLSRKQPGSRAEAKVNNSLVDKLEAIGQPILPLDDQGRERDFRHNEMRFYQTVVGGTVTLDGAEWRAAIDHMESALPNVHRQMGRSHEDTHAWLEAVPEQDASPVSAEPPAS